MRIAIDTSRCCGAGQCVLSAPEVFDQDEATGIVVLLDATPSKDLEGAVRMAADVCPAQVISIEEA
jgi:ferredoxin